MIASKLSLLLTAVAALSTISTVANAAELTGYLMDRLCISNCENSPAESSCAPDGSHAFYTPQHHTGWCLLFQPCIDSGYMLVSETTNAEGKHRVIANFTDDASHAAVIEYVTKTSGDKKVHFPLVTVEHGDDDVQLTSGSNGGSVVQVTNAVIKDTWPASAYTGEDGAAAAAAAATTTQTICKTASEADIDSNNMCFRSDVKVTKNDVKGMIVIESNGCPDHPNMKGGSEGVVENNQEVPPNMFDEEAAAVVAVDDEDLPYIDLSGALQAGCAASNKCCSGSKCSASSCSSSNKTCSATTTAVDRAGCSSSGGSCATSSNKTCSATGCCAGGDGSTCCSCNNDDHGVGTYTPMYQHYTMMIPQDPGTPGEPTKIEDDVVGIMTNGVLLDVHSQTWSYDLCNGHSDKKHQYHYHIPPICYLEKMGVTVPNSPNWWINSTNTTTEVLSFEEMANQFPAVSGNSPVVGYARDGFPIKALYDSSGKLQRSAHYGGSLDECNGKTDGRGYAYYITADPPFVPTCLRGTIGSFSYATTDIACPEDGIENTFVESLASEENDSADGSIKSSFLGAALATVAMMATAVLFFV